MNADNRVRIMEYTSPADIPEEKPVEVSTGFRKICLLRRGGKLFAFSARCPHAGAALCEGHTDARGHLVCPLHGYRFELSRGYNSSGEGYKLKTFPVEIRADGIFVVLPPLP